MTAPRQIDFLGVPSVSHDPGVTDREAEVAGVRWGLVEYSPGAARRDWCDTPHAGYVVSGAITYSFEDDRDPLVIAAGEAFALPTAPRHRGANQGQQPARLFIIDALPGSASGLPSGK
jgi:quercetin dioxygenase-like cupin family protein